MSSNFWEETKTKNEHRDRRARVPKAPDELGPHGASLWKRVHRGYRDIRPDEFENLLSACRMRDEIARLEQTLANAPVNVKGSRGQPVANPLFAELRAHRQTFAALLKALDLEPVEGSQQPAGAASSSARQLALTRWRGNVA